MGIGNLLVVVVLGIVEGFTEFIPVSSTGHLILAGSLLGFTGEKAATFEVAIQMGAILAVMLLYRGRLAGLRPGDEGSGFAGTRGLGLLLVTTAPSLVVGAMLNNLIKARLFTPLTVAIALGVGAVAILVVERLHKPATTDDIDALTWRQALAVGLFQCLAMWPGMSRSAATIVGGMLGGLGRRAAAEYSFLAAIPVMLAATAFDLYSARGLLGTDDLLPFGIGFAVAFLAAGIGVKTFLRLLGTWTLSPFAWYRIALAGLVFWLVNSVR